MIPALIYFSSFFSCFLINPSLQNYYSEFLRAGEGKTPSHQCLMVFLPSSSCWANWELPPGQCRPLHSGKLERGPERQVSLSWWGREEAGQRGLSRADHLRETSLARREGPWTKTASSAERRVSVPSKGTRACWEAEGLGEGRALAEQEDALGSSSLGKGAQPSGGGGAAPEGTQAPIPFICRRRSPGPGSITFDQQWSGADVETLRYI